MNVTVEDLAPCKKLLRVELDAQTVNTAFEEMTSQFQRQVNLPGFRPGKAPRPMVEQRFSTDIEQEVKKKLIPDTYRRAVTEQKLSVVGYPDIEEIQFGRNQALQFAATVETAPEFELPEYKGLPAKRESTTVTPEDIQRAIDVLREQRATYTDVQRPIADGDFIVVNYQGTSEGKPLTELAPTARGLTEQKNFWMRVQPNSFIAGFTEQLLGANAGDKRTVTVDFPADFVSAPLAGKKGVYEVEIVQVKERVLPELNEELAKSFGAESLEQFQEGIRADLQNELNYKQNRDLRNQIVNALLSRVTFELPETMVSNETRNVVYDIVRENQQRGITKEDIDNQKEQIYAFASTSAKERVKATFVLNRIATQEGIRVEDQELAQRIYALAAQNNMRPDQFAKQLQERSGYSEIKQQILVEKVLNFLQLHAKVEEETSAATSAPETPTPAPQESEPAKTDAKQ